MKKLLIVALAAGALIGLAGILTANAAPNDANGDKTPPSLVAIALGVVNEADGGRNVVDFRAAVRDGDARGNLRIYSSELGYYNGAVRQLSVDGGVIKASGGGLLLRPDGTRGAVRYKAQFNQATKQVTITVEGRNGYNYSLSGSFDPGFIKAGPPPAKDKAAKPKKPAKAAA